MHVKIEEEKNISQFPFKKNLNFSWRVACEMLRCIRKYFLTGCSAVISHPYPQCFSVAEPEPNGVRSSLLELEPAFLFGL